jgi:hypothetical protein
MEDPATIWANDRVNLPFLSYTADQFWPEQ